MTTELAERYLTLAEAAAAMRLHTYTLRRRIKRGELPARAHAGKYLIDRADLDRFRDSYSATPGPKRRLI